MASASRPDVHQDDFHFIHNPWRSTIVANESTIPDNHFAFFLKTPLYAPLLYLNLASDARDHCANERTFLSWLRLSLYLGIVSAAIFLNFHLKYQPSDLERRTSQPLGYIFWVLAVLCLGAGFSNYVRTVAKYASRSALVQHGVRTQIISTVTAVTIIVACIVFLVAAGQQERRRA